MLLNSYLRDNPASELTDLQEKIKDLGAPYKSSNNHYIALIKCLFNLFLRENVTGPSIYSLYVEEEKRPLQKGEPLVERELDPISYKNESL